MKGLLKITKNRDKKTEPNKRPLAPVTNNITTYTNHQLTERETQVLQLSANGFSAKQIADMLFISSETVNTHTRNTLVKLGARNAKHAIAIAIRKKTIK